MPDLKKYTDALATANMQAFLMMIRKGEGTLGANGYHIMFTGKTFTSLAKHPNVVNRNSSGLASTAAGAYQFLYSTWQEVSRACSFRDFSERNQDIGAVHLISAKRGALEDVLKGNVVTAIKKCAGEWASLPYSTYGQPTQDLESALAFYRQQGGTINPSDTGYLANYNTERAENLIREIIRIAKSQIGTREQRLGSNSGPQVSQYLASTGTSPGQFWCMSFVYWCFNQACLNLNVKNPLVRTAGVQEQYQALRSRFEVQEPYPGCVVIYKFASGNHTGIVTGADSNNIYTVEGNTTSQGQERNGDGVYPKVVSRSSKSIVGYLYPFTNAPTPAPGANATEEALAAQARDKMLAVNLQAIQENVDVQELDNVKYGWGSRQSTLEQSDWIGLRQYIMYLSMTYLPQGIVPFVELIPKFFLDSASTELNRSVDQDGFEHQFSERDRERFLRMRKRMEEFNTQGGIDLLTLDPFGDNRAFNQQPGSGMQDTAKGGPKNRNIGYKIYGQLVLNPAVVGNETAKAGAVGFKSLDISQGASTQQGMTLVTIKMVDVQGNKFFDMTSPWSFFLNPTQVGGDFFLRYGWQVSIPDFDKKIGTIGYKFWNHPGWKVFGTAGTKDLSDIDKLKNEILSLSKFNTTSDSEVGGVPTGTLTITQSNNPASLIMPGWHYERSKEGLTTFVVDRKLDISHYVTISLINPEMSIDSSDGSVTATLQFRTAEAMANCLIPLAKASKMHEFVNDMEDGTTTLDVFMRKFVEDNYDYVTEDETLKDKKVLAINPNSGQDLSTWLQVNRLSTNSLMSREEIASIKIKITNDLVEELNTNKDSDSTNLTLRGWLSKVLSENNIHMLGAGDGLSTTTANPTGGFVLGYDDKRAADSVNADAIGAPSENAIGYFGVSGKERLMLQDDVFAFRFRGSLVEQIEIATADNSNEQMNKAQQAHAENTINTNTNSAGGNAGNNASADPIRVDRTESVTWSDKKRNLHVLLSKMGSATIRCIAHPWIKVGFTVYIKGTGYFDGKYLVSQHKLNFEENKFISEITCVRVQVDDDYVKKQEEIQRSQEDAFESGHRKAMAELMIMPWEQRPYAPINMNTDRGNFDFGSGSNVRLDFGTGPGFP